MALNAAKLEGAWPDSPCTPQAGGASGGSAAAPEASDQRLAACKRQNQRAALAAPVLLPSTQGPVQSCTKNRAEPAQSSHTAPARPVPPAAAFWHSRNPL